MISIQMNPSIWSLSKRVLFPSRFSKSVVLAAAPDTMKFVPQEGASLTLKTVVLQVTQASPRSVDQVTVKSIATASSEDNG